MSDEERIGRVEEAIVIMKDLLINHSDRLDDYFSALERERQEREESRKDFEFKLNALIDAQMRNEIEIRELKEASKSQLERIEKLEGN